MKHCNKNALPHNPDANGGGSKPDWDVARLRGVDVYAVGRIPRGTISETPGARGYRRAAHPNSLDDAQVIRGAP